MEAKQLLLTHKNDTPLLKFKDHLVLKELRPQCQETEVGCMNKWLKLREQRVLETGPSPFRVRTLQGMNEFHSGNLFEVSWPRKTQVSPCMPSCELTIRSLRLCVSKTSLLTKIALHKVNLANSDRSTEGQSCKETHHFHPAHGRPEQRLGGLLFESHEIV